MLTLPTSGVSFSLDLSLYTTRKYRLHTCNADGTYMYQIPYMHVMDFLRARFRRWNGRFLRTRTILSSKKVLFLAWQSAAELLVESPLRFISYMAKVHKSVGNR